MLIQPSTVHHNTTQPSKRHDSTAHHNKGRCSTMHDKAAQHMAIQPSGAYHNTTQTSKSHDSTAHQITAQHKLWICCTRQEGPQATHLCLGLPETHTCTLQAYKHKDIHKHSESYINTRKQIRLPKLTQALTHTHI